MAILPFEVQSGDAVTLSAANGVVDEIATVLSGAQFLTVGADQTASLRGANRDAAIARLGFAFLMDGSIERDGDVLTARVRLGDVRAGG